MEHIEIKTLIDITKPSKINRPGQGTDLEQNQYKNWITLQQCLGLRSIIEFKNEPFSETIDVKGLGFGTKFKGEHRVWTFRFWPDRQSSYDNEEGNNIGLLENDLHQVPIIKNLNETINTQTAVFDLKDTQYRNLLVRKVFDDQDTEN